MGLDRLLMLAKRIPDIRLLRSGDPRVAGQMLDLAPYRPVSSMPAITPDLSIAVADDDDEETLGDRIRDALGADARQHPPRPDLPGAAPGNRAPICRPPAADQALTATPGWITMTLRQPADR